jgi:hypothetical protein
MVLSGCLPCYSQGFGPELFGKPLDDEEILDTKITKKGNLTYYEWWVSCATCIIHWVLLLLYAWYQVTAC